MTTTSGVTPKRGCNTEATGHDVSQQKETDDTKAMTSRLSEVSRVKGGAPKAPDTIAPHEGRVRAAEMGEASHDKQLGSRFSGGALLLRAQAEERLAGQEPIYQLEERQRLELHQRYATAVARYATADTDVLLSDLAPLVDEESHQAVRQALSRGVLDASDLRQIRGYIDFATEHGLRVSPLTLEVREEKRKAYVLIGAEQSLIRSTQGRPLMWTHDAAWAHERFYDNNSGRYLLGQFLGSSKFASLAELEPNTSKQEALELLGLNGYPDFDKPGPLFLVEAKPTAAVIEASCPRVPLVYKVKTETPEDGSTEVAWRKADNFQANSIPGFTSAGLAEVVIRTFEIEASSLTELGDRGAHIWALDDDGEG